MDFESAPLVAFTSLFTLIYQRLLAAALSQHYVRD